MREEVEKFLHDRMAEEFILRFKKELTDEEITCIYDALKEERERLLDGKPKQMSQSSYEDEKLTQDLIWNSCMCQIKLFRTFIYLKSMGYDVCDTVARLAQENGFHKIWLVNSRLVPCQIDDNGKHQEIKLSEKERIIYELGF